MGCRVICGQRRASKIPSSANTARPGYAIPLTDSENISANNKDIALVQVYPGLLSSHIAANPCNILCFNLVSTVTKCSIQIILNFIYQSEAISQWACAVCATIIAQILKERLLYFISQYQHDVLNNSLSPSLPLSVNRNTDFFIFLSSKLQKPTKCYSGTIPNGYL